MKNLRLLSLVVLFAACPFVGHSAVAAESPELADARAKLLEYFQAGRTDNDELVKGARAKITALEYIAAAKPTTTAEAAPRLVNVDFPGGPAGQLFSQLNQDKNSGLNIIGEKSDLVIELPAFSIRNADGASLAGALDGLLRQRGYALQGGGKPPTGLSPVYLIRKLYPQESGGVSTQFQSFQLAPYLEQQSVDDIVSAIRTAWELDPANSPTALRMKFHPATGILLVSAPQLGTQVVQTVLGQLRKKVDSATPRLEQPNRVPAPNEKK